MQVSWGAAPGNLGTLLQEWPYKADCLKGLGHFVFTSFSTESETLTLVGFELVTQVPPLKCVVLKCKSSVVDKIEKT